MNVIRRSNKLCN